MLWNCWRRIYDFGVKHWFVILNCVLGNHNAEYGLQKYSVERCCHTINLFGNTASNLTGQLWKTKKESDARVWCRKHDFRLLNRHIAPCTTIRTGKFCLWSPELRTLEIQNSAQGIRNPADSENLEPSSYSDIESGIHSLESRIHSVLT